jgi:hypothetical protein
MEPLPVSCSQLSMNLPLLLLSMASTKKVTSERNVLIFNLGDGTFDVLPFDD